MNWPGLSDTCAAHRRSHDVHHSRLRTARAIECQARDKRPYSGAYLNTRRQTWVSRRSGTKLFDANETAEGNLATEHGRAVADAELATHLRTYGRADAIRAEEDIARGDCAISERERDWRRGAAASRRRLRIGDKALRSVLAAVGGPVRQVGEERGLEVGTVDLK
jgi:hypothetical protein